MNAPLRLGAIDPSAVPGTVPSPAAIPDADPQETAEWIDSLAAVVEQAGPERARFLLDALQRHAARNGLRWRPAIATPYVNTIPSPRSRRSPATCRPSASCPR
jgi:pyruvate dehydrogenase E1 component